MTLKKRGKYRYGDSQADIRTEVLRYSKTNDYPTQHFADAACKCGGKLFRLALDDDEWAAIRHCVACQTDQAIGDSDEYLEKAELGECACPCGGEEFEIEFGDQGALLLAPEGLHEIAAVVGDEAGAVE